MSLITPHLYLGDAKNAQDTNFLQSKKITFIVNCAKEIPNYFEGKVKYLRLDLGDVPSQNIKNALTASSNAIISNINRGIVTFVHCAMGISRSSSVVIHAIMKLHEWPFETAYRFVKDMHPNTRPNPGFVDQLIKTQNNSRITENSTETNMETDIIPEQHNPYGVEDQGVTSLTLDNEHPRPGFARSIKNPYAKIFSGS